MNDRDFFRTYMEKKIGKAETEGDDSTALEERMMSPKYSGGSG